MGSVTNLQITGDNDSEIYPVKYYNHYLYCDNCGSFELESLAEPRNIGIMESLEKWVYRVTALYLGLALFWMILDFELDWLLIISMIIILMGAYFFSWWMGSTIEYKGALCTSCKTLYPPGSIFFKSFKENPRHLTMDDVPKSLSLTYQIRGKTFDEKRE